MALPDGIVKVDLAHALEIFCSFRDRGGFGAHGEKCADQQDSGAD
jgi:hypothetical protein